MRTRIMPYRRGSASALALARAMGVLRLNVVRTTFRPRPTDVIINWGCCDPPIPTIGTWFNRPMSVMYATNKLLAYQQLAQSGVPVPEFTADPDQAGSWSYDGYTVLARTMLRAHGGRGIEIVPPEGPLPHAPLYTKYVKKADEYRVHVVHTEVIDVQQKKRRRDYEGEVNNQIRNYDNGWVFCREEVEPPEEVLIAARRAVGALGLMFGAVDIGWNRHFGQATVYEVNSAPGIEGTTVGSYARALNALINGEIFT
jgi:hypothetical protein